MFFETFHPENDMQAITHLTIAASAGTGKTYQLVHRYIKLLVLGVQPRNIVALTFTRKAAGEIFDRVIGRIAEAVNNETVREEIGQQIDSPLSKEKAADLLITLIHDIPLLRIGTLDSFMTQIVRAFSFDLGIQGGFEIIDGAIKKQEEQQVLRKMLSHTLSEKDRETFLTDFRLATFGTEKNISETLSTYIERYHNTLLAAPDGSLWGNTKQIWPSGNPLLKGAKISREDYQGIIKKLYVYAEEQTNKSYQKAWIKLLEMVEHFTGHGLEKNTLLERMFEDLETFRTNNHPEINYSRKTYSLTPENAQSIFAMLAYLMGNSLQNVLERTQGIFRVLENYETTYNHDVRMAGKLSFSDIVQTLIHGASGKRREVKLTQEQGIEERSGELLYIDYRLDGRFDHWMIDEFQDTSNTQWQTLENLIDELFQYDDGSRTFFYVGDVKQAIYGWRGGDSRLFEQVFSRYNPNIEKSELIKSWRSAPAIINTVNRLFDQLTPEKEQRLSAPVLSRWEITWNHHETARQDLPGYGVLYEIAKEKEKGANEENRYLAVASIIKQVQKTSDLSIGVLVRSNKAGIATTDILRQEYINAAWEGDSDIIDNTVTAALLSLIKLAEHPADTFAWEHVKMTPLATCIQASGISHGVLPARLLRDIHNYGFHYTLNEWIEQCRAHPSIPSFSVFTEGRLRSLLQCALEFDQRGERNTLRFIQYVRQAGIHAAAPSGQVRVLSIHKSKGLEFDVVLLPDLQTNSLTELREIGLTTHCKKAEKKNAAIDWVLLYPQKIIATSDPVLDAHKKQLQEEATYEELCALYVAMTRARHALYMITTDPGKTSKAFYASTLLKKYLADDQTESINLGKCPAQRLFHTGDPLWYQKLKKKEEPVASPALPCTFVSSEENHPERLQRYIPSDSGHKTIQADLLFSRHGREAADFGTAIHALFEEVEWLEVDQAEESIMSWSEKTTTGEIVKQRVISEFRAAIKQDATKKALQRPGQPAEVWREKRFEIAMGERWISGCFDRVTILKDAQNKPEAACILDYKSNRINNPEQRAEALTTYRPQLNLYREVLSRILHLPSNKITTQLLFTCDGTVATL